MIVGSAGNGPDYASMNYSWSEKYWENTYGYSILTADNETYLSWKLIESSTNKVLDRMLIKQVPGYQWTAVVGNDDTTGGKSDSNNDASTGWDSYSDATKAGIVVGAIVGFAIIIAVLLKFLLIPKLKTWSSARNPEKNHLRENEVVSSYTSNA